MFSRAIVASLAERLKEPRRFIQIILGPRQVGKTTAVRQLEDASKSPFIYASADEATNRDAAWIESQWQRARVSALREGAAILALDEIQKIPAWTDPVKALWDSDTRKRLKIQVLLLGSTPLFAGRGVEESLAGRFEVHYAPHWSFSEMKAAFKYTWDEYLFFGGYPGAAPLRSDIKRWRSYMRESVIEATVGRDLLATVRIAKPALLRQTFFLACEYAGQVLSYTKMLGQLQDAGNTTTLAHYLDLLAQSGLVAGIQKVSSDKSRTRGSSPKLLCLDPSLTTATDDRTPSDWKDDAEARGRLIESVIGAHLWRSAQVRGSTLNYWTDGKFELDFIYKTSKKLLAIEVKSGRRRRAVAGLAEFKSRNPKAFGLIVGTGGVPLTEFLNCDPEEWLSQ